MRRRRRRRRHRRRCSLIVRTYRDKTDVRLDTQDTDRITDYFVGRMPELSYLVQTMLVGEEMELRISSFAVNNPSSTL